MPIVRGDNDTYLITVFKDDGTTPLDLSLAVDEVTTDRPAILQYMVKRKPSVDLNPAALLAKYSYYSDELDILDQSLTANLGKATLYIDKPDTKDEKIDCYTYEVQVSRQDFLRTSLGTASNASSTNLVVGTGTDFLEAKEGDILHWTSGANIGKASIIESITDDANLVTERVWVGASSGDTFEIRRAQTRTRLQGVFNLLQEVNR